MSSNDNIRNSEKEEVNAYNKKNEQKAEEKNQSTEKRNTKSCKPFHIALIIVGIVIVVVLAIVIPIVVVNKNNNKKRRRKKDNGEIVIPIVELNENNNIKMTMKDNFVIPSDGKIQIVGADFQHKNGIFIIGKNKTFIINNNGQIEGVTENDLPLSISFNETITNGSYLFKGVTCFKTIDLSKMDSSKLIDASNMFEDSDFEEIYFWTENEISESTRYLDENSESITESITENFEEEEEEDEKRKNYFDTSKITSASQIFMNCRSLKKIQLPPSFNVGKNATGMFKGCSLLEEVNITLISSTEIEDMDSMFEDCQSLKEISFSNDFLTGEIKTLNNVFKNTNLEVLDISYLRLFSLENCTDVFEGASIKGTLKIGKYFSDDDTRDNLFKEIAKVTDKDTNVFTPNGTTINQIFENIYYTETNIHITVTVFDIDYNIHYKKDESYKIYSNYLHVGLGWDFDVNNTYDLDSSVVTFDSDIKHLSHVYFSHLSEYNGSIRLSGDDLTGEGEGDDEEIFIHLDSLPSNVQKFTVQLNSFKRNSLKDVKSAYIRLSTDTEVIGTYSITQAGNNIGLLIGCFSKSNSNEWYFRPLNKVIPGNVVISSVKSIQEILHLIFDNKLISSSELVNRLMVVANGKSVYSQEAKYNSLYWNGTHWFADCSNLIKSIINGRDVYNPKIGSYQKTFPVVEDVNANGLISISNNISNDFTNLGIGIPKLLHLRDNNGNGHVGIYLGQTLNIVKGKVNVIESTTSWQANSVIYSWVDSDGTRRFYEGGPTSNLKWTSHGSLDKWVWLSDDKINSGKEINYNNSDYLEFLNNTNIN